MREVTLTISIHLQAWTLCGGSWDPVRRCFFLNWLGLDDMYHSRHECVCVCVFVCLLRVKDCMDLQWIVDCGLLGSRRRFHRRSKKLLNRYQKDGPLTVDLNQQAAHIFATYR